MDFKKFCISLEAKIKSSYEEGVTLEAAEKLAGEFLRAQMVLSNELKVSDLDSRMRKSGLKAVRAAVYMKACSESDKKPTENALENILNTNEMVQNEQDALDKAEVERDDLKRYYDIFREAHIYFRGIAKGNFS